MKTNLKLFLPILLLSSSLHAAAMPEPGGNACRRLTGALMAFGAFFVGKGLFNTNVPQVANRESVISVPITPKVGRIQRPNVYGDLSLYIEGRMTDSIEVRCTESGKKMCFKKPLVCHGRVQSWDYGLETIEISPDIMELMKGLEEYDNAVSLMIDNAKNKGLPSEILKEFSSVFSLIRKDQENKLIKETKFYEPMECIGSSKN